MILRIFRSSTLSNNFNKGIMITEIFNQLVLLLLQLLLLRMILLLLQLSLQGWLQNEILDRYESNLFEASAINSLSGIHQNYSHSPKTTNQKFIKTPLFDSSHAYYCIKALPPIKPSCSDLITYYQKHISDKSN